MEVKIITQQYLYPQNLRSEAGMWLWFFTRA
jgi:hypothetical protein